MQVNCLCFAIHNIAHSVRENSYGPMDQSFTQQYFFLFTCNFETFNCCHLCSTVFLPRDNNRYRSVCLSILAVKCSICYSYNDRMSECLWYDFPLAGLLLKIYYISLKASQNAVWNLDNKNNESRCLTARWHDAKNRLQDETNILYPTQCNSFQDYWYKWNIEQ